jgi:hypothetical protein
MTGDRKGRLTPFSHLNIVMANHGGGDQCPEPVAKVVTGVKFVDGKNLRNRLPNHSYYSQPDAPTPLHNFCGARLLGWVISSVPNSYSEAAPVW